MRKRHLPRGEGAGAGTFFLAGAAPYGKLGHNMGKGNVSGGDEEFPGGWGRARRGLGRNGWEGQPRRRQPLHGKPCTRHVPTNACKVHTIRRAGSSSDSNRWFAKEKFANVVFKPPPCSPSTFNTACWQIS